jgi:ArsR family transcriptional regulator
MHREQFNEIFKSLADFFGILSNPDRLKILGILLKKEMDVNEIHNTLLISQSRVSQHLKLLKYHSLVSERREGKHVFYSIKDPSVSSVIEDAFQFYLLGVSIEANSVTKIHELMKLWKASNE